MTLMNPKLNPRYNWQKQLSYCEVGKHYFIADGRGRQPKQCRSHRLEKDREKSKRAYWKKKGVPCP